MLETIRRNNKKILAVVGVFLMIAFIIPTVAKRPHNQMFGDLGKIDGKTVPEAEYGSRQVEWRILREQLRTQEQIPVATVLLSQYFQPPAGLDYYSARIWALEQAHALMERLDAMDYLLLVREAQQMKVRVPSEIVEEHLRGLRLRADEVHSARIALHNWLLILSAFDRAASAAMVSPALVTHRLAQSQERIALELVEFEAARFRDQVPAPTEEQLEAFFNKYRDVDAATSQSGFGYRYPDRVRIQYLRVAAADLKARVTMADIYEFYKRNPRLFPNPPASQPAPPATARADDAEARTTAPATVAAAATAPTTRPWEDLTSEDYEQIRTRIADERGVAMMKAIGLMFQNDWPAFRQLLRESPAQAMKDPYVDRKYLIQIASRIKDQAVAHGVEPTTVEEGQLMSQRELAELTGPTGGIGGARTLDGRLAFPVYAIGYAEPLMLAAQLRQLANRQGTLALFQPSAPLRDQQGNYYLFRLVEAVPAHSPQSMAEVADRVRRDYITAEAYNLAKQAAAQFLKAAEAQGLAQASKAAGDMAMMTTELFGRDLAGMGAEYQVPAEGRQAFAAGAFALLQERLRTQREHPLGLIEMPRVARVAVARLARAEPALEDPLMLRQVWLGRQMLDRDRQAIMLVKWLDPEAIHQRMKYVPHAPVEAPPAPRPAAPPRPLI